MSPRSTAGVGLDPLRWLPQLYADDQLRPPVFTAAAALAGTFDTHTYTAGAPLPQLAARIGQHPDRLRRHLRELAELGWTEVVRPASRGRGHWAVYSLEQPALPLENTLVRGAFTQEKTTSDDGISAQGNTLVRGGFESKTPSQDGVFQTSVLIPVRGREGMVPPTPQQHAAAGRVVAGFPARMVPASGRARTAMGEFVAELIAAGWEPGEVAEIARHQLPAEVYAPLALLEERFRGRLLPQRTPEPAPRASERWREELAAGPDPERIKAGAAELRRALRGAS